MGFPVKNKFDYRSELEAVAEVTALYPDLAEKAKTEIYEAQESTNHLFSVTQGITGFSGFDNSKSRFVFNSDPDKWPPGPHVSVFADSGYGSKELYKDAHVYVREVRLSYQIYIPLSEKDGMNIEYEDTDCYDEGFGPVKGIKFSFDELGNFWPQLKSLYFFAHNIKTELEKNYPEPGTRTYKTFSIIPKKKPYVPKPKKLTKTEQSLQDIIKLLEEENKRLKGAS